MQNNLKTWQIGTIIASTILLTTWIKQDSLESYWQQTYQSNGIFAPLNRLGLWNAGEKIEQGIAHTQGVHDALTQASDHTNQWFNPKPSPVPTPVPNVQPQPVPTPALNATAIPPTQLTPPNAVTQPTQPMQAVRIHAQQKVFFVGDSMMQGVAPWVMRDLQKKHQIHSLDLSKQSTGLTYSKFFDWPATIEKTFKSHPDIGALVIFLGANDALNIYDAEQDNFARFNTARWHQVYQRKIQHILTLAQKHRVQVIWVTPPSMKDPELAKNMLLLSQSYHQAIAKHQALIIDSKPLLQNGAEYSDSIRIDGKITKVRTADGIHFTPEGQKLIAKAILNRIQVG